MFDELDVVKLRAPLAGLDLPVGALGTILEVFSRPDCAYLVEFSDEDGQVLATEILKPAQVERVWSVVGGAELEVVRKAA